MATKRSSAPITLRDVAKLSGVSFQTVSRVVNNSPDVSSKTRRQVLQAIEELGYQPNLVARGLKTGQSMVLEMITFGVDTFVPRELMEALGRVSDASGYRVVFSDILMEDPQAVNRILPRLNSRMCDGALITSPVEISAIDQLMEAHPSVPIVQIRNKRGSKYPSVIVDQSAGSHMATQHLIDLGHRRIAEISGPLYWHEALSRHESYHATLRQADLSPTATVESVGWMPPNGYDAAHKLLDQGVEFTGLVVANDYLALGAILALSERGLRVPDDISIVGFDDTPEAAFFMPPLTTIRQDYEALGRQAIQYMLELINNPETPAHQRVLMPQLIERKSTRAIEV
jgi:LacI family transcriptional regulator